MGMYGGVILCTDRVQQTQISGHVYKLLKMEKNLWMNDQFLCRGLILKVQQFTYLLVRFMILFQNTGGVINNN